MAGLSPIELHPSDPVQTRPEYISSSESAKLSSEKVSPSIPHAPSPEAHDYDSGNIENVDITALIRSHADYPNALQLIIPLLRLEE